MERICVTPFRKLQKTQRGPVSALVMQVHSHPTNEYCDQVVSLISGGYGGFARQTSCIYRVADAADAAEHSPRESGLTL